MKKHKLSFSIVIVLGLFFACWKLVVGWRNYPVFIFPPPELVLKRLVETLISGVLLTHMGVTLVEVLGGLALGCSLAMIAGYFLAKLPELERGIFPIVVALQAVPVVAAAPLVILWFGTGLGAKMVVCAATLFFPVLINTVIGFRQVSEQLEDLMQSLGANWWQKFRLLEFPSALPVLLGGLKIGVGLSVIGAVVGEFVGAKQGLGFLVNLAGGLYDTPLRFVGFLALGFMAVRLYLMAEWLEKKLFKLGPRQKLKHLGG